MLLVLSVTHLVFSLMLAFANINPLQEYHDNIGDLEGPEEKERGQARIQLFISAM